MALPPGAEPLDMEDDQGAPVENPDGAQAWHRPVLYVVAGVTGVLVIIFAISWWQGTGDINPAYIYKNYHEWQHGHTRSIGKDDYDIWQKRAIGHMMQKYKPTNVAHWPVTRQGLLIQKEKSMLAIGPPLDKHHKASSMDKNLNMHVLSFDGLNEVDLQFGWFGDKFKHIGIGMEGASNVNQNENGALDGRVVQTFKIGDRDKIHAAWLEIVKKHIPAWKGPMNLNENEATQQLTKHLEQLKTVLDSVESAIRNIAHNNEAEKKAFDDLQVIVFEQNPSTQIVFTAIDVFKETGEYYIRNNKGNKDEHADVPTDLNGFFFAMPFDEKNKKAVPSFCVTAYRWGNIAYDNVPHNTHITVPPLA